MLRKISGIVVALFCLTYLIAAPVAAQDKVKVTIFVGLGTGTDPDQIPKQEAIAEKFNSSHDTIEIEFLIVPNTEARTRLQAMLTGDSAPQLVGPNGISTIAAFFDSWEDITPYIEAENFDTSDFYGPALDLNKYPTINTGLPLGLFPSFILYNKDVFDASGVEYPTSDYTDTTWTLDELKARAMLMSLDSAGNDATSAEFDPEDMVQWGYSDAWTDGRGSLTMFGAPNVGRPTTDDYKTAVANSEEWVYGMQWLSDGMWKDHFIPNNEQSAGIEATGAAPFDSGLLGMFYTHTWYLGEGLNDVPFEWDVAPLPFNQKGDRIARIHADNFTIPKIAQHKDEAWEVMKWLTAPEQIVEVCLVYGCVPARESASETFRAALQEKFPDMNMDVVFEAINYLDVPNHESWVPEWGRVGDAVGFAWSQIGTGEIKDGKTVLDQANTEIQQILDEYWASQPS